MSLTVDGVSWDMPAYMPAHIPAYIPAYMPESNAAAANPISTTLRTKLGGPLLQTTRRSPSVALDFVETVVHALGPTQPKPQRRALDKPTILEATASPAPMLFERRGGGNAKTRRVAVLVCDGVDSASLQEVHTALIGEGVMPRFLGVSLDTVTPQIGKPIKVDVTFESTTPAFWDAVVIPAGVGVQTRLQADEGVLEFVKEQYRQCKLIVALGELDTLVTAVGMRATMDDLKSDPGIIMVRDADSASGCRDATVGRSPGKFSIAKNHDVVAAELMCALAKHRFFDHEIT